METIPTGRNGKGIVLKFRWVPSPRNELTDQAEILEDGQEVILMKGGRGGLGNSNFQNGTMARGSQVYLCGKTRKKGFRYSN